MCSLPYRLGNFQMEDPVSNKIYEQNNERWTESTYTTRNLSWAEIRSQVSYATILLFSYKKSIYKFSVWGVFVSLVCWFFFFFCVCD